MIGTFSREQLGLPPRNGVWRGPVRTAALLAAVMGLAGFFGMMTGRVAYTDAEAAFMREAEATLALDDVDARKAALRALQERRPALSNSVVARLAMAEALSTATAALPDAAWPYWQNARLELRDAQALLAARGVQLDPGEAGTAEEPAAFRFDDDPPAPAAGKKADAPAVKPARAVGARDTALAWMVERLYAVVLLELKDARGASSAMDRADAWLLRMEGPGLSTRKRGALNDRAYLMATADDAKVYNPEASLRLATAMLQTGAAPDAPPDRAADAYPTATAAYVDTLASAYAANERWDEAYTAQRMALGLADGADLSVYVKRYREIAQSRDAARAEAEAAE